jgi:hypothetical protein
MRGDVGQQETEMRMRAFLRMMVLGTVATLPSVFFHAPVLRAAPTESEHDASAVRAIKGAILKATGYADATVTLTLEANQFWVTVENGPLNDGTARQREAQAARIAVVIADKVKGDVAFAGILGIHIDYAARSRDGSHNDIVDSIDFRKGLDGKFTHHTT